MSIFEIQNINGQDVIFSKDFEYFEDNLLAGIRERENGILIKEILYGSNKYSEKFYDFIFDAGIIHQQMKMGDIMPAVWDEHQMSEHLYEQELQERMAQPGLEEFEALNAKFLKKSESKNLQSKI